MKRLNEKIKNLLKKSARKKEGSALILVIIASIILTLLGLAGLTQAGTELTVVRNYKDNKEVFYAADAGINTGINLIKHSLDPSTVIVNEAFSATSSNNQKTISFNLRSGRAQDTSPQPVKFFKGYNVPPPPGISIELSGEISVKVLPWILRVTAERGNPGKKNFVQKELETVVVSLTAEY